VLSVWSAVVGVVGAVGVARVERSETRGGLGLFAAPTRVSRSFNPGYGLIRCCVPPSDALDQHRAALSAADADRRDAATPARTPEDVQDVQHDPRTRRADRVAQRDRAAVDVELGLIERPERRIEAELGLAIGGVVPRPIAGD